MKGMVLLSPSNYGDKLLAAVRIKLYLNNGFLNQKIWVET